MDVIRRRAVLRVDESEAQRLDGREFAGEITRLWPETGLPVGRCAVIEVSADATLGYQGHSLFVMPRYGGDSFDETLTGRLEVIVNFSLVSPDGVETCRGIGSFSAS